MTPQLIAFDGQGRHSTDLEAAAARVDSSGIWEKQRTIAIIPAAGSIPTKVAMAQWCLALPPNQGFIRIAAIGYEVGKAYSAAIEAILGNPELSQWEYVLTLEHDNLPPADGLMRLIARMKERPELAAIGGLYWTKGEGGVPQIWGDAKDPIINYRPQPPNPAGELVECCGLGMGFTLFRLSMFRDSRIPRPLFETVAGPSGYATQDLSFWTKARPHGYRCAVDCSVRVGHYDLEGKFGPPDFTW